MKIRKLIVIRCWPVITIQMASCTKVLLSKYITIGLQGLTNVLLGVPKKMISWLVLGEVIECILNHGAKVAKF